MPKSFGFEGMSGAGKTTLILKLNSILPNSFVVPEWTLSKVLTSIWDQSIFYENDLKKLNLELGAKDNAIVLQDRSLLSTLVVLHAMYNLKDLDAIWKLADAIYGNSVSLDQMYFVYIRGGTYKRIEEIENRHRSVWYDPLVAMRIESTYSKFFSLPQVLKRTRVLDFKVAGSSATLNSLATWILEK